MRAWHDIINDTRALMAAKRYLMNAGRRRKSPRGRRSQRAATCRGAFGAACAAACWAERFWCRPVRAKKRKKPLREVLRTLRFGISVEVKVRCSYPCLVGELEK